MNFLDLREPVSTWSHCAGLLLALPGTVLLWRRGVGDLGKRLSLLLYGLTWPSAIRQVPSITASDCRPRRSRRSPGWTASASSP